MNTKSTLKFFKNFIHSSSFGGILLILCVGIALLIANSSLGDSFENVLAVKIGPAWQDVHLHYSVQSWINDGLMAIFFLLVGLEIKRELVDGALSSPKNALLPILAALGGALLPAVIYYLFNKGLDTEHGWGIPMATDIAFALAVIISLGNRVPISLKIFIAALAIVDDLLAILVVAFFLYQRSPLGLFNCWISCIWPPSIHKSNGHTKYLGLLVIRDPDVVFHPSFRHPRDYRGRFDRYCNPRYSGSGQIATPTN